MRAARLLPAIVLVVVVLLLAWLTVAGPGGPSPRAPTPSPSPVASASTPTATPTATTPDRSAADPATTVPDDRTVEEAPAAAPTPGAGGQGDDAGQPDADPALMTVRLSAQELSDAATQGIPDGTPVESIQLAPGTAADGAVLLDVRADVVGLPVDLTGEIAVEVTDGRLAPRLVEARVGAFGLPEGVRATIDDALERLGDDLVGPGRVVDDVRVVDGALVVDVRST